jgi:glycosyltransferase involved in cell wall biosynthesis
LRVLHVTSTICRGGIASSLGHLLSCLQEKQGIDPEVASLFDTRQPGSPSAISAIGVHWLALGAKYSPRAIPRLARLLHQRGYHIIHSHGWPAVLFVALLSLVRPGPRYLMTDHNVFTRRRRWYLKPLDRFIYSRYEKVIAVSQAVADSLGGWLPEVSPRVLVIHNGVIPAPMQGARSRAAKRAELGVADEEPLLLSAAGLERRKGVDVLLRALALLNDERQNHPLSGAGSGYRQPVVIIAGGGGDAAPFHALVATLGLEGQVRYVGVRDDMAELMAAADGLVVPSRWEGCPMVVLEAMAAGLPVIASRVGGIGELLEDGDSGLLVTPDDPQALAAVIARHIAESPLRQRLAARARERLERSFSAAQMAERVAQLYLATERPQ